MEFGKYIGKGMWGLADKALPVVYGAGYVLLVIRVLPEEEFGNFVLLQEVFLILSGLATAFALQPLLKFAAEDSPEVRHMVSAGLLLNVAFLGASALFILALSRPLADLLNADALASLLLYVPAMLAASLVRNFALIVLQARFRIQEVFWTDAAHFLGAPFLTWIWSRMHMFDSALDLVYINILSLSLSSLVGLITSRSIVTLTLSPGWDAVRRMWEYGRYTLGGIVSYFVYSKSDSFILSAFSGPAQVALYNSVKVFVRVYEMVGQIVQMFVLPAVSRLSWQKEFQSLKSLIEKSLLFFTVSMIPVFILFAVFPPLLVSLLYQGRYAEAAPVLQVFSLLSFVAPVLAIGSSVLLGLGRAKENFVLGLETLLVSGAVYLVTIPWMGSMGAAAGYIIISFVMSWLTLRQMNRAVPLTLKGVLRRHSDIAGFLRTRIRSFSWKGLDAARDDDPSGGKAG